MNLQELKEQVEEKPEEESREDNCTAEYDCQCPDCLSNRRLEVEHAQAQVVKTLQEYKDEVALNKHQIPFENLFSKGQGRLSLILKVCDEAAELYASQFKAQSGEGLRDPK